MKPSIPDEEPIDNVQYDFEPIILFDVTVDGYFETWTEFVDKVRIKDRDNPTGADHLENLEICRRVFEGFIVGFESETRKNGSLGKRRFNPVPRKEWSGAPPFSPFSDQFAGFIMGSCWRPLTDADFDVLWSWLVEKNLYD